MALQFRRGTDAGFDASKLLAGEPAYTTDTKRLYIANGDGSAREVMFIDKYASGTGLGNANKVDHAIYADSAASATNATNANNAASGSALAQQIAAKAPLDSPTFTGVPSVNGIKEWGSSLANQVSTSWQNLGNAISSLSGGGMIMVMGFNLSGGAQCFFLLRVMVGSVVAIASVDNTGCGVSFQMSGLQPQIKTASGTIQYAVKEWII